MRNIEKPYPSKDDIPTLSVRTIKKEGTFCFKHDSVKEVCGCRNYKVDRDPDNGHHSLTRFR